jgi:uncharacterized Zn-binding protein involved in type VI secretion
MKPFIVIGDKVTCPWHGRNGIVMIATGDVLIAGQMPSTD